MKATSLHSRTYLVVIGTYNNEDDTRGRIIITIDTPTWQTKVLYKSNQQITCLVDNNNEI